jgi:shikimate kinase
MNEAITRILRENIASSIKMAFDCARRDDYLSAGYWCGLAACDVLRFPTATHNQRYRADLLRHGAMSVISKMQKERNQLADRRQEEWL